MEKETMVVGTINKKEKPLPGEQDNAFASFADSSAKTNNDYGDLSSSDQQYESALNLKMVGELNQRFVEEHDMIQQFRQPIMDWFLKAAGIQLGITNVLLVFCLISFREQLAVVLDFFKYFIAFTFVEILGGLIIIVRFLFNDNLYKLLRKTLQKNKVKDKSPK